ncbi:hypothetical protein ACQEVM_17145 [Streptomyces sp. CA-243310]|uniref:hypothetical protein n=1 Tax=Streptomyces sp. CA-243310 TaxID=3240056 RepID=UPI003D9032AF
MKSPRVDEPDDEVAVGQGLMELCDSGAARVRPGQREVVQRAGTERGVPWSCSSKLCSSRRARSVWARKSAGPSPAAPVEPIRKKDIHMTIRHHLSFSMDPVTPCEGEKDFNFFALGDGEINST